MSCQTALYTQTVTLLSVPQEILLLQHKVFREYAKITVGPDFIHTLPSFMILAALTIVLWRNPPSSNSLAHVFGPPLYKALQVMVGWVVAITGLWLWLILQRLLYCCVWSYWSYDFEDRDISYQWWQRVWSSYYPPPLQPPVMSAGFISWILSMSIAVLTLSCALSTNRIWNFITDSVAELRVALVTVKHYVIAHLKRMLTCLLQHYWSQELPSMKPIVPAESEASSMCDDCRSEISSDIHNPPRMEIHPVSYGTNWTPKPCFSGYKEPQRKVSMKSLHTVAVVDNVEDSDKLTPKQLRHRRGCHTVIPSNSSDKSSGC
ncbi:PREDICTED: uncharacterized protein LOC107188347 [Dufourea novaeangliae]|uniref:uncharacterized protein LOC107188347 n=1 Tax=Dufourea novaeangliae TaxID=178035 RepID=UPI000767758B|nr:PREDICTED: uncharacterized protein LOC107188347 [Dufourea novaeangliae]